MGSDCISSWSLLIFLHYITKWCTFCWIHSGINLKIFEKKIINKYQTWSSPSGLNCWTSVAPAFQSWFAVQYSTSFISVMNLDLYVRCFNLFTDEVLHVDRNSMCIWTTAEPRVRLFQRKTGLSPTVIYNLPFQGDASVVVYSNCQCSSAFCFFDLLFTLFIWSLPFYLPRFAACLWRTHLIL